MNKEVAKGFTEMLEIRKHLPSEVFDNVPQEFWDKLEYGKDTSHQFKYDTSKSLLEQDILPETKGVITYIYRYYLATPEQRMKNIALEEKYLKEKRLEKYNDMLAQEDDDD